MLEQKIELEIRLRELAAQAMLEARDEIDALEVEKSLLTSDQRVSCYTAQLEQRRKQLSNRSLSTDSGRGSSKSGRDERKQNRQQQTRSDVIGPVGADTTSSPTHSSNSQSPSKLSPVSGQSTDLNSLTTTNSSSCNNSTSRPFSRTGGLRRSSNTLNRRLKGKNKHKDQTATTPNSNGMSFDGRATLSVSDIRIPLMWRDVDHFKGRGDYKRFAMFCLLKIDSQIYDSQLICDIDRDVTDVTFDDVIVFNDVEQNFELKLELYSCVYLEEFSLSSAPRKLKEKLTSSVSRAMGRWLALQTASANYTKELEAYDKSYRFSLIASATLRLEDASDSVRTYDLNLSTRAANNGPASLLSNRHSKVSQHSPISDHIYQPNGDQANNSSGLASTRDASKNTLPLFGHFCCKLHVRCST